MTSDTGDRENLGGINFPKLQCFSLSRSRKLGDGSREARKTWRGTRFEIINFFTFRSLGKIRRYCLQKSLHFVLVSSRNNIEVICIPPFFWIIILTLEWQFKNS